MKTKKTWVFLFFVLLNFLPQSFVLIARPDNLLNWYSSDDAFYYFKTAQNITEGKGITFDGLAQTNGFHPLWMIVCIPVFALAKSDLYLPLRVLAAVQILLNAASGFFLYLLISEKINARIAWLSALFWMFFLTIHEQTTRLGLETGLTAWLLITFIYRFAKIPWHGKKGEIRQNILWASLCGIGVLLSRLDNIFLLIMAGLWIVFHGKRFNKVAQIDFILILISSVASYFIRLSGYKNIFDYLSFLYLLTGLSLIVKPILLYLFGSYKSGESNNRIKGLAKIFIAMSISSAVIFLLLSIFKDTLHILYGFPRSAVLIDWGISFLLLGGHHFYQRNIGLLRNNDEEDIALKNNWHTWVERAFWFYSPILITLILYLFVNIRYAGTAMPVSGQIKHWWGTIPNTVYGRPISTLSGVLRGLLSPSIERGPFWLIIKPLNTATTYVQKILDIS